MAAAPAVGTTLADQFIVVKDEMEPGYPVYYDLRKSVEVTEVKAHAYDAKAWAGDFEPVGMWDVVGTTPEGLKVEALHADFSDEVECGLVWYVEA